MLKKSTVFGYLSIVIIGLIYVLLIIAAAPGGWSNDSMAALRELVSNEPPASIKPMWSMYLWRLLKFAGFDIHTALFYLQNIVYLLATVFLSLSILKSNVGRVLALMFLLFFPPFLGVSLTNWTNSLSFGLFIISTALILRYLDTDKNIWLWMLPLFLVPASILRWEAALLMAPIVTIIVYTKFRFTPFVFINTFLSGMAGLVCALITLSSNQFINDAFSSGGRETLPVYRQLKELIYLSAELDEDLLPEEFMKDKFLKKTSSQREEYYSDYRQKYKVWGAMKILDVNVFIGDKGSDFDAYYKRVHSKYKGQIFSLRVSEFKARLTGNAYGANAISSRPLEKKLKRRGFKKYRKAFGKYNFRPKLVNFFTDVNKTVIFKIWPYFFSLLLLTFIFGFRVLFSKSLPNRMNGKDRLQNFVGFSFAIYGFGLIATLGAFSGNLEFRYIIPSIFSLFICLIICMKSLPLLNNAPRKQRTSDKAD